MFNIRAIHLPCFCSLKKGFSFFFCQWTTKPCDINEISSRFICQLIRRLISFRDDHHRSDSSLVSFLSSIISFDILFDVSNAGNCLRFFSHQQQQIGKNSISSVSLSFFARIGIFFLWFNQIDVNLRDYYGTVQVNSLISLGRTVWTLSDAGLTANRHDCHSNHRSI